MIDDRYADCLFWYLYHFSKNSIWNFVILQYFAYASAHIKRFRMNYFSHIYSHWCIDWAAVLQPIGFPRRIFSLQSYDSRFSSYMSCNERGHYHIAFRWYAIDCARACLSWLPRVMPLKNSREETFCWSLHHTMTHSRISVTLAFRALRFLADGRCCRIFIYILYYFFTHMEFHITSILSRGPITAFISVKIFHAIAIYCFW